MGRKNRRGRQQFRVDPVENVGTEYFMDSKSNNVDEAENENLPYTLDDLDFENPISSSSKHSSRSDKDCTISIVDNHGKKGISFIFRACDFIEKYKHKYLEVIISKNGKRLYFTESERGRKCTNQPSQVNCYMKQEFDSRIVPFIGHFPIRKEQTIQLYFVDLNDKFQKEGDS